MEKRINNKGRRISIGALLVFALLVSVCLAVMPFAASAADTEAEPQIVTTEAELTAALAAGGNIKLGANITVTGNRGILEGITVVLDLSGFKLDYAGYTLRNYGTLELCDSMGGGSLVGIAKNVIANYGRFTLTSGTVSNNTPGEYSSTIFTIYNASEGELIINGGTVTGENNVIDIGGGSAIINGGTVSMLATNGSNAIVVGDENASLTVNGGEIHSIYLGIDCYGALEMTGGTIYAQIGISSIGGAMTVSGGKISDSTNEPDWHSMGIQAINATLNFSGDAVIELSCADSKGVDIVGTATVNVLGGTINAKWIGIDNRASLCLSGGTITGGIKANSGTVADCLAPGYLYYDTNGAVITLTEGQTELSDALTVGECKSHTLINGICSICKYVCPHESVDAATGICNICNKPSALNVIYGMEIAYFNSLADALARAEEIFSEHGAESIIKLQDNITVSEALTMTGGAATIDLNGKKIAFTLTSGTCFTLDGASLKVDDTSIEQTGEVYSEFSADPANCYCMTLTNSSVLTWEGGTLNGSSGWALLLLDDSRAVQNGGTFNLSIFVDKGTYILNDGLINGNFDSHTNGNSEKYATNLVLNGGTISLHMGYIVSRAYPTDFNVTVTGGTFDYHTTIIFEYPSEMKLSGGTFSNGISLTHWDDFTLRDALAPGYLYYDENGNIITLSEGQMEISEKVTVGPCEHDFSEDYFSDSYGHWHECKVCGIIDEKLAHTPEDDDWTCLTAVLCSACGYETTKGQIIHDFNNANLYDSEGHWHKCSRCDQTAAKLDHSFTVAQNDGTHHWNKCEECDAIDEKIAHIFNTPEKDGADHWNKCFGCDEIDAKVKHSGTDDGDCTTPVTCSCGHVIIEKRDAHDFSGPYTSDADGHERQCANCSVKDEKKAHTPNVDAATEETRKYCLDCNYEIEAQLAHTHKFVLEAADDKHLVSLANCTSSAVYYKSCSCGTSGTETFTHGEALGHTPADDDGDCTTDILCSVCSEIALEGNESHTGGVATCTEKAHCSVCDTPYGELDEDNHTYGDDGKCACGAEKPEDNEGDGTDDGKDDEDEGFSLAAIWRAIVEFFTKIFKAILTLLTF